MNSVAPATLARQRIVLASASPTRARLLADAGIEFDVSPARMDEDAAKASLIAAGAPPPEIAVQLAELKARQVSGRSPGRLVLGADQVMVCDGRMYDKPSDAAAAAAQLMALRGRWHEQISAACVVRDGERLWHHVDRARLYVRPFSEAFLQEYLRAAGPGALNGPGAYQLEGVGVQLFSRVEGDFFTVLGLPLLAVLDHLRSQGVIGT
jgi:septum formation protein